MKTAYTDQGYAAELEQIRSRLLTMVGRVEEMIVCSVRSLLEHSHELARDTILSDHAINQDEIDLDALCLELLACRQPMASDLRFITLALKMVTDLERIADLAVNICERTLDLENADILDEHIRGDLERMGVVVRTMVRDSMRSFVSGDIALAESIEEKDDEVDALYHGVFSRLLSEMVGDVNAIQPGIHIQSVAKVLERMGDHCTNLAEQVIFMFRGTDVRHQGKL